MSEEIIKEIEKQNNYLKEQGFTVEQRLIINKLIANKEYLIKSQLQEKEKIIEDAIEYNKRLCELYDCGMELSNAQTNLSILERE